MIQNYGCTGTLTINSIALNGPAWDIPDLTALWIEATQRGEDRLIPGAVGVIPYRRRLTVTEHTLGMWIVGDTDRTGAANADAWIGLQANIEYLRANVVDPTNLTDGTRVATLTMPNGSTRTANIHVTGMRIQGIEGDDGVFNDANAVLMISIPAGRFA
jgi:hypothetical protein